MVATKEPDGRGQERDEGKGVSQGDSSIGDEATLTRPVRDRTYDRHSSASGDLFLGDGPSNHIGSIMEGVLHRVGTVVVHIWCCSAPKSFGHPTIHAPGPCATHVA